MLTKNETLLFEIPILDTPKQNPSILRVILTKEFTRIDFGYTTPWYYIKGGWIKIAPETYLQNEETKEQYKLKEATGILIAPKRINFESTEDWQFFSLYFDPIPMKDCVLNMIEAEKPTPNDFNYYGIELKMKEGMEILNLN
ncbi:MAG: hypothetical protein FGM14_01380 [Flavobacteriales bacterium]|nr:hypothetical protein [Flavobacteriales bacterium]